MPNQSFKIKHNFFCQSIFHFFQVNIVENNNTKSVMMFGLFALKFKTIIWKISRQFQSKTIFYVTKVTVRLFLSKS